MQNIVQKELNNLDSEQKDSILENFDRFKQYLLEKIEIGESMGLSDDKLAKATELVANDLAKQQAPRKREGHLLME